MCEKQSQRALKEDLKMFRKGKEQAVPQLYY